MDHEIPEILLQKLEEVYNKLKQNFWLGKYEECLEKIGKFVEVSIRVLEHITTGNFTSFEEELSISDTLKKFENLPKNDFPDSVRILIPRVLYSLYTFRSKRGGAHIKGINPNHIDATYVVSACDWIVAELIRLYHTGDEKEVWDLINSLVDKKVPVLEEFGEDIKILDTSLLVPDKILLILYRKYPQYVSKKDLKRWVPTKSPSHIPTTLKNLDKRGLIYVKRDLVKLTIKGIKHVEDNLLRKELKL
ncbi:hypothetical protein [Geoglobus ahangari]|nr:hypothetical protein [Geoglobus ahangari]